MGNLLHQLTGYVLVGPAMAISHWRDQESFAHAIKLQNSKVLIWH